MPIGFRYPWSICGQAGLTSLTTPSRVDRPFRLIPSILEAFGNLAERIREKQSKGKKSALNKHCRATFQRVGSKIGNFNKLERTPYLFPKSVIKGSFVGSAGTVHDSN